MIALFVVSAGMVFMGAGCAQNTPTNSNTANKNTNKNQNVNNANKNTNTEKDTSAIDEDFDMAIGDVVTIEDTDMDIEFTGVKSDSRCPEDGQCLVAGKAQLEFDVTVGKEDPESVTVTFDEGKEEQVGTTVGDYVVTVTDIEPVAPKSGEEIAEDDYSVTVLVEEAGTTSDEDSTTNDSDDSGVEDSADEE